MKGGVLQILWHGSDPILTVDFHLSTGLLATGGADRDIKLWSIRRDEKSKVIPSATFKANLSYHNAAVNMVRFSRSEFSEASNLIIVAYLMQGSFSPLVQILDRLACILKQTCVFRMFNLQDSELLIWKISQTDDGVPIWKVWKNLRGHTKDVLGLDWSSDDTFLVSCSVDNTCLIWNIARDSVEQIVSGHQHYVQGVTWDPTEKYLASISADRSCRIYSSELSSKRGKGKEKNAKRMYFCQHVLSKTESKTEAATPTASTSAAGGSTTDVPFKQTSNSKQFLFHDENMPSFFRRLSWSPDGSFLLVPAGIEKQSPEASPSNVSYIVSRNDLSRPLLALPAASKPVVATRFCPVLFSLQPKKAGENRESGAAVFDLPYKLVFAVATLNSVYIYDTERSCPLAILGGLHFAAITDIAWSHDAKFMAISSQDGYCTLVGFDEGDLGTPARLADLPSNVAKLLPVRVDSSSTHSGSTQCEAPEKAACSPRDFAEFSENQVTLKKVVLRQHNVQIADLQPTVEIARTSSDGGNSQTRRRLNPTPVPENFPSSVASKTNLSVVRPAINLGQHAELNSQECRAPVTLDFRDCPPPHAHCAPPQSAQVSMNDPRLSEVEAGVHKTHQNESRPLMLPSRVDCVDGAPDGGSSDCQARIQEAATLPGPVAECSKNQPFGADSAQGPSTPAGQDHGSGLDVSPVTAVKPVDLTSDIYVRPLKFRRMSPCKVAREDGEGALMLVGKEVELRLDMSQSS